MVGLLKSAPVAGIAKGFDTKQQFVMAPTWLFYLVVISHSAEVLERKYGNRFGQDLTARKQHKQRVLSQP
jgi:hypothetical protein